MGLLLGKIYSGLLHHIDNIRAMVVYYLWLHEGRLWVAISEIGMDKIMSRWPINIKPWVAKYLGLQLQPK